MVAGLTPTFPVFSFNRYRGDAVAYDLLFRKQVKKNFALSSIDVSTSEATVPTDAEKSYLANLAVLKMDADAGNKKAKKAWSKALGDLSKLRRLAQKGDPKAAHLLTVVRESGLFEGVAAMDVSGAEPALTPKAEKLLTLLGKVKSKALDGDARALALVGAINKLRLDKVPGEVVAGEDADGPSGQQAARRILEDAADSKKISRSDLKKAILLYTGKEASDRERVAVGSKVLTFLQKKNIQITS
jgi:hypothetical protein